MNAQKLFCSKKGSYTVEACLVVTTVMFVLFTLVFGLLFLTQKAMLTAVAESSARQGAEIWVNNGLNKSLYYRITSLNASDSGTINISKDLHNEIGGIIDDYNTSDGTGKKIAWIKYQAYKELGKCLLKPDETKVEISYNNYFIKSRVKVVITQEIKIPFGFIKAFAGGKETLTLKATGTANVVEPAEYIRNIDLAVEYGRRISEGFDMDGLLDRVKDESAKE